MSVIRLRAVTAALVCFVVVAFPLGTTATTVHSPPWADVMSGPMWNFVDPRVDADHAVSYLHSIGYTAFDDDNNTSATQAIGPGWAQDDAVWVAFGHAIAGQIVIEKGATGGPPSAAIGVVLANRSVGVSPDWNLGPRAYLYDLPYHRLSKMKLMAFIGCDTGNNGATGSYYDGNLVKEATGDQGVDAAIGFTHEIYYVPDAAGVWTDSFFHSLYVGTNVSTAASNALNDVVFQLIFPWGFDNPYIIGGSTKIKPAAYGS